MFRGLAPLVLVLCACRPVAEPAEVLTPEAAGGPVAAPAEVTPPETAPEAAAGLDDAAIEAILADPARPADERALDPGREPAALLRFLALRPGLRLADLGAGRGYTTFLLARAVGPEGVVYAHNNQFVTERFLEPAWTERLKTPEFGNVVRVDREFDDPLPPEATGLDGVINVLFYHDTFWMGTDRARMNQAIFAALRPGGWYVIIDHSARPGAGGSASKTLHRVEEATVEVEVLGAGFQRAGAAEFLRNPADPLDWNAQPSAAAAAATRGTADRFVLKFIKP